MGNQRAPSGNSGVDDVNQRNAWRQMFFERVALAEGFCLAANFARCTGAERWYRSPAIGSALRLYRLSVFENPEHEYRDFIREETEDEHRGPEYRDAVERNHRAQRRMNDHQSVLHSDSPSATKHLLAAFEEALDAWVADTAPAFALDVTGRR